MKIPKFITNAFLPAVAVSGAIAVLLFTGGTLLGSYLQKNADMVAVSQMHPIREINQDYKYINPLLAYDNEVSINENKDLESKINDVIKQKPGTVSAVSVYYRGVGAGVWVGINENEKYDPASMLKIVIMIAYLKEADENRAVLNKKYTYSGEVSGLPFETPSELQMGQSYTTEQLIENMIEHSDNGAMAVLLSHVDANIINQVYGDLGIQNPDSTPGQYLISAKSYSLFFRILINATYLSREMSEKALGILSHTTYKDGLAAGMPDNITVAHKFGEHVEGDNGAITSVELHDCGLVYLPNHRYFLCVMTKGGKLEDLSGLIKNISAVVYKADSAN